MCFQIAILFFLSSLFALSNSLPFLFVLRQADETPKPQFSEPPNSIFQIASPSIDPNTLNVPEPSSSPEANASPSFSPRQSINPASLDNGTRFSRVQCFPASAPVLLANGKHIRMDHLRVGDLVAVPGGSTSVIMWTHWLKTTWTWFVRLRTEHGGEVQMSDGHFVHTDRGLLMAAKLVVGDKVRGQNGLWEHVVQIDRVWRRGLFNPQTETGEFIVGGVVVTCYTHAVHASTAHALLAPIRWAFMASRLTIRCAWSNVQESSHRSNSLGELKG